MAGITVVGVAASFEVLKLEAYAHSAIERIVAAITIDRRETDIVEILLEGDTYWISVDDFSRLTQVEIALDDPDATIVTPLGSVRLERSILKDYQGQLYISNLTIAQQLQIATQFDPRNQSLDFTIPWGTASDLGSSDRPLRVQVSAPSTSVSTLRQFAFVSTPDDFASIDGRTSTSLDGRLWGGNWRVSVDNRFGDFEDTDLQPEFDEYFWRRRQGRMSYLVGRQAATLHPLLDTNRIVGGQIGWSNLERDRFAIRTTAGALFPRQRDTIETFRGEGIPTGFAVLRVDGRIIEQQQVGFDGIYEFVDVPLDNARLNEVEILLFDRANLSVPAEIRTFQFRTSQLLLPGGGASQVAGAGVELDDGGFTDRLAGFAQTRWGVTDNLTLEGAIQNGEDGVQAQVGSIWSLGPLAIAEIASGVSREKTAYSVALDGELGDVRWQALWEDIPDNYFFDRDEGRQERSFELDFPIGSSLRLGAIARDRKDESTDARYVLPTFSWQPRSGLSLRGRPDLDGDYRLNGSWSIDRDNLIRLDVAESTVLSYRHIIDDRSDIELSADFFDNRQLYAVTYGWRGASFREPTLRLGVSMDDRQQLQAIVGASARILPGVVAGVFYEPVTRELERGDLTVTVSTDLGFANNSVVSASQAGLNERQGAIAGRIIVANDEYLAADDSYDRTRFQLAGIRILVDDRVAADTDLRGGFFLGGLPDGIYRVQLDIEKLPFELVPVESQVVAEVAAGAVSTVNFVVQPEYGLAGRVQDGKGEPLAGVPLLLVSEIGDVVGRGSSDRFGLYRIDGVPPGQYKLQIDPTSEHSRDGTVERSVAISQDFLFGIDLQIP